MQIYRDRNLRSFLVCTIYQPPKNRKHLHENFAKLFDDMLSLAMRSFKELILLGDMNVNYLVKVDQNEIKSVISSRGIEQLISSRDLIKLIQHPSNISSSCVFPLSIGDHDMVGCLRKINC